MPLHSWRSTEYGPLRAASDFAYLLPAQVTNPQNIGMMLRSFAAGDYINGVIIPRFSCPPASHPLVIKASAGTVLHSKVKILDCRT